MSPNYTANCTSTATIDVHEITGKKVTWGKSTKATKLFFWSRKGEKIALVREGEKKENVKCQVQIPIQVPMLFWDLERHLWALFRGDFSLEEDEGDWNRPAATTDEKIEPQILPPGVNLVPKSSARVMTIGYFIGCHLGNRYRCEIWFGIWILGVVFFFLI